MSIAPTIVELHYPESDGQPMGETDLHRKWMNRICDLLSYRYRGQRVYVTSNVLVYYVEGSPSRFVVPDDIVVKDCPPGERRVFKIWTEGKPPDVAVEVTSASTQREDTVHKTQLYARMGIKEFFLYDPTSDYLRPPLQGFHLDEQGEYANIEPDATGALYCEELDILLRLEAGELVMHDRTTGELLLTESEAEHARYLTERAAKERERIAKEQERAAKEQERAAKEQERAAKEQERAAKELERIAKEQERIAKEQERAARETAEARAAEEERLRRAAERELQMLREQLKRLEGSG